MEDLISRRAAIDAMWEIRRQQQMLDDTHKADLVMQGIYLAEKALEKLPSAQPEIIRCKECKYWKDSDGVYRRGFDAESKCPLNLKKVYEGTFYCGMAERRTDG